MARPAKFKAGRYWIGDLCHAPVGIPKREGVFSFEGHKCWFHYTYGGDGIFWGTDDKDYCVDGGNLGIVPAALMSHRQNGNFHKFTRDFEVLYTSDGMFSFGDLLILTNYRLIEQLETGSWK